MIEKIKRQYYLLRALHCAGSQFTATTYVIYLQSNGLNLLEVNMVNVVFFTTLFLCEIPTGAFADVFGRKMSCIMACIIQSIGFFTYGISNSFWEFAASEAIIAIGATFMTGAFKAWFVDKLRHCGYQGRLDPIFAKANQISSFFGIITALTGSFLAEISFSIPWFCAGASCLLFSLIAINLQEEYFIPQKFSFKDGLRAMIETARTSFRYGRENKNVRFVLVLVVVQLLVVSAPNMYWQPLFVQSLSSKFFLGFIWTGISLTIIFGSWLAPRILDRIKDERKALLICQVLTGIFIFLSALFGLFPLSLTFFLFQEISRGAFGPIKEAYLHDNIPSKERATIDSFESLAHHLGGALGLFLSGVLAQNLGIRFSWMIMGTFMIMATFVVMKNGRR